MNHASAFQRLAIIPARGGSKRVPRKNIREVHGKPILAWTIQNAIESSAFDRVVVSTEDEATAKIAQSCGADVPFRRSPTLADDLTPLTQVIADALNNIPDAGRFQTTCCLLPTSALADAQIINEGRVLLESQNEFPYVMTVKQYPHPIERALSVSPAGLVQMRDPSFAGSRTQDCESHFYDAGQFYWGLTESWRRQTPVHGNALALPLGALDAHDIDTEEDWAVIETLMRLRIQG